MDIPVEFYDAVDLILTEDIFDVVNNIEKTMLACFSLISII